MVETWLEDKGETNVERRKFAEPAYFEDLQIGQTFYIPSRTQIEALFAAFQLVSADNHPLHYDIEYCKKRDTTGFWRMAFKPWCKPPPELAIYRISWAMR
jgi:acyl dehydratase